MFLEDWNASAMASWADVSTAEGACSACHGDGEAAFNTDTDDTAMFELNQLQMYIRGFFSQEIDPVTGTASIRPDHDKLEYFSNGGGPGINHPLFNYGPETSHYQYLQDFYDLAELRRSNLLCRPPSNRSHHSCVLE
jgi:hypothetical protein